MSDVMKDIVSAARRLLRDWRALALFVILFDVMLLASYLFFATREASVGQLFLTTLLALVAIALFFIWQTMGVSYTPGGGRAASLLGRGVRGAWRPFVVSLPLLVIAFGLGYLFSRFGAETPAPEAATGGAAWKATALTTQKYLLFGVFLPLAAIHLWIAAVRRGVRNAFGRLGSVMARAFGPGAVLIYLIGLFFFGVVPYFLLFTRTPINRPWVEITLLGVRLALSFLFVLVGWTVTLGALSERDARSVEDVVVVVPPTTTLPPPPPPPPAAPLPAD